MIPNLNVDVSFVAQTFSLCSIRLHPTKIGIMNVSNINNVERIRATRRRSNV